MCFQLCLRLLSTFIDYDGNIIKSSSCEARRARSVRTPCRQVVAGKAVASENRGAELRPNGLVATSNNTTLTRRHRSKSTRLRLCSSHHILLIIIIKGREPAPRTSGRMLTAALHERFAATVQQHH